MPRNPRQLPCTPPTHAYSLFKPNLNVKRSLQSLCYRRVKTSNSAFPKLTGDLTLQGQCWRIIDQRLAPCQFLFDSLSLGRLLPDRRTIKRWNLSPSNSQPRIQPITGHQKGHNLLLFYRCYLMWSRIMSSVVSRLMFSGQETGRWPSALGLLSGLLFQSLWLRD